MLLVDAMGVPTAEIQGLAGTDEEETRILVQPIETCEIEIAAIQDVNGAGLDQQMVEDVDVVNLPIGDLDRGRDVAP